MLSVVASAIHLGGFIASDVALAHLLDGLGFLAILMLLGPFGIGLVVIALLEAVAAVGLFGGAMMLLGRRSAAIPVTVGACVSGCVTGVLLATQIFPAPILFGKTVAGLPSSSVATVIGICVLALTAVTMALALARPTRRWCSR